MRCKEVLAQASEYIDDQLSEQICADIRQHMAECGNCRMFINTLEKTVSLYRLMPGERIPDQTRHQLYKVLDLDEYTS